MRPLLRKCLAAVLLTVVLAGVFAGCQKRPEDAAWKKSLVIVTDGPVKTLDPQAISNAAHDQAFRMIYDTLLVYDPETKTFGPGLAEKWEWTDETYTSLRLTLRSGVKFQSGEEFTPEDVVFTLDRVTNSTVKNSYEHSAVSGERQVTVWLSGTNVDFLFHLASCTTAIVSKKAVEADPDHGPAIGTGPWAVDREKTIPGTTLFLKRFDGCWREKPVTEEIELRYVSNDSGRLVMLENGEADAAVSIAYTEYGLVRDDPNLVLSVYVGTGLNYLAFNTSAGPGADEKLRLAVSYAVDRQSLMKAVGDAEGLAAVSLFATGASAYTERFSADTGYQPEKAKALAAELGENAKLKLMVNTTIQSYKTIAEVIQEQCRLCGITVTIEEVDAAGLTANSKFSSPKHEALVYTIYLNEYNSDISRLLSTGISSNKAVLTNERILTLLDEGRATDDEARRKAIYGEIQTLVHDHCYYLPLFYGSGTVAWRKGVEGIAVRANARHEFSYIRARAGE